MTEFSLNGTAYDVYGLAGSPTIVLIHGLGLNRLIWDQYVSYLAVDYRVICYDLFAHGESGSPPAKPSLALFSEQLLALLDELSVAQASLVGFSLGGMINRRLAIDHPHRVQALAILNSPHERGAAAQQQVERRAMESVAGGPEANLEATLERWFTPMFRATQTDYIDQVRQWLLANEANDYALCRQVLAYGVVELIRPQPPIRLPTLVVTCQHDSGSTPAMSHAIAGEIDGSIVTVVPNLQHMGLCEKPALFVSLLSKFLQSLPQD